MKLIKAKNVTSVILEIFIQDSSSTTGAGLAGLTNASGGLTCYYHRNTAVGAVAVALVTMTVGAFTSSGFKEIDATNMPGFYQLCLPDAAFASGADSVTAMLKGAANMAQLPIEIQLALVGTDDRVLVSANTHTAGVTVAAVTGAVASVTNPVTTGTNNDKTGYSLSAGGIQAIWDALTSALTTVGSIGKRIVDNLDVAVSSRSTYAGADTSGTTTLLSRLTAGRATNLDNLDTTVSSRLSAAGYTVPPTAAQNATALLDSADAIETGLTPRGALRLALAGLAGKLSGALTGTVTFRNAVADSKARITATVDGNGNRTAITTDTT